MKPSINPQNLFRSASAAGPVVYRSLSAIATPSEFSTSRKESDELAASAKSSLKSGKWAPSSDSKCNPYNLPCVSFANQLGEPLTRDQVDLEALYSTLKTKCTVCEFRKTISTVEFLGIARIHDGHEQCSFSLSFWFVPETQKIQIQADRYSGCPYFFRNFVKSVLTGEEPSQPKLFRCLELPADLKDPTPIDACFVEDLIRVACSAWLEQRVHGMEVLADLLSESAELRSRFVQINGLDRISPLSRDPNVSVRSACARIVQCTA